MWPRLERHGGGYASRRSFWARSVQRAWVGAVLLIGVAACVTTRSEALNAGASAIPVSAMQADLPGTTFQANRIQRKQVHTFAFHDGGALTVNGEAGGTWSASQDGVLCLGWPIKLQWGADHCFHALSRPDGIDLFDNVIEQHRFNLVRLSG